MIPEIEKRVWIGIAQIVTFKQVKLLILSITQESGVIFNESNYEAA
jgi:hypothetical protein